MLTFALIVLAGLLGLAVFVVWQLWRQAVDHATDQADLLRRQCQEMQSLRDELDSALAELDALSICGPPIDPIHGGHDRLPIRDDIRATLTAYCEGMWQHTLNGDTK